jgi:ATP-dependent RNA helicase DeaD
MENNTGFAVPEAQEKPSALKQFIKPVLAIRPSTNSNEAVASPTSRPATGAPAAPDADGYIPKVMDFNGLGLHIDLQEALTRAKFTMPTEIQAKSIPFALEGKDVLGSAQTGTGKTFAFAIPLINKLMNSSRGIGIIILPTRELAVQVEAAITGLLGFKHRIRTAVIIGGEPMPKQYMQLKANPRIIVGTPGRINDHLQRGTLKLHDASYLVLDETDRMLDMGFGIQIDEILKYMPKERQTMLFSATIPPEIARLSKNYLKDPVRVSVGSNSTPATKIKQVVIQTSEAEKYNELVKELELRTGSVIIFAKTKRNTEKLAEKLQKKGYKVDYIHGDLKQSRRDRAIDSFRKKKYDILVATDIASRGLDVPHIEHVINYDLPQCPEDYIHRIGRTARAGAEGAALSLISPADNGKWKDIQRLINPGSVPPRSASSGNRSGGGNRDAGKPRTYDNKSKPKKAFFGGNKKGGLKTFGFKNAGARKPSSNHASA